MIRFSNRDLRSISVIHKHIKTTLTRVALYAAEADPKICKGEFTMLMMKFSANKQIATMLRYMEGKMGQLLDYEFNKHQLFEERSIFKDLVMRFASKEDLL